MKQYLADTNFLLRFLLNDIPEQAKIARGYLLKAQEGLITVSVPSLVFVELDFALLRFYKFGKPEVAGKLLTIAEMPFLDVEKKGALVKALSLYGQTNISFVDALFLTEAGITGKKLLTFDEKLKKL